MAYHNRPQVSGPLHLKLDTGSRSNTLPLRTYQQMFGGIPTSKILTSEHYVKIDVVQFDILTFPGVMVEPRDIPAAKKQKLLKLAKCFVPAKKRFRLDLPSNDASHDLVEAFD